MTDRFTHIAFWKAAKPDLMSSLRTIWGPDLVDHWSGELDRMDRDMDRLAYMQVLMEEFHGPPDPYCRWWGT